jgi:hypothetical protein
LLLICLGGAWLIAVGCLMIAAPGRALRMLGQTASSWRVNLGEQVPRLLVGVAMAVRADHSLAPQLFALAGWFLALSSALLLLIPLGWHAGYAKWWARRLPSWLVRLLGPLSILAGGALIRAAWR